jgi:beta propeller repeat protein
MMKGDGEVFTRGLAVWAVMIMLIQGALAASTSAGADTTDVNADQGIFLISGGEYDQMNPHVYGDTVVWEDERNEASGQDIYSYDLSTEVETPYSTLPGYEGRPEVYDDTVVWEANDGTNESRIYVREGTGSAVDISAYPGMDEAYPHIDGDYVVWQCMDVNETSGAERFIAIHQLSTGETHTLIEAEENIELFGISDGLVAYAEPSPGSVSVPWLLRYVDIKTGDEVYEMDLSLMPVICFTDGLITNSDAGYDAHSVIQEIDPRTGYSREILELSIYVTSIDRYGDVLVLTDLTQDLMVYDISKNILATLSHTDYEWIGPSIHGDIIVWHDYDGWEMNIFGYDLSTDANSNDRPDYEEFGTHPEPVEGEDENKPDLDMMYIIACFGLLAVTSVILVIILFFFLLRRSSGRNAPPCSPSAGPRGEYKGPPPKGPL